MADEEAMAALSLKEKKPKMKKEKAAKSDGAVHITGFRYV
jgi:hypothetical protein